MTRPALSLELDADEFAAWYWLKQELQSFCRQQGWPAAGSKQELMALVHARLAGQPLPHLSAQPRPRAVPLMPALLALDTRVAPGWRLNAALRAFFVQHLGPGFRFNQALRQFFREPQGRTLADAIALWKAAELNPRAAIERQFQFNRHVRNYFAQHPGATRAQMLQAWHAQRQTAQALVFPGLSARKP
jgi:hypothetical protein